MKKKAQTFDAMEEEEEEHDLVTPLTSSQSDICQSLMERYSKSSASQHRHLCASAAAMKSILQEENLPLTPLTYFAATISAISDGTESLDSNSTSALYSFLSILLPLIPSESLSANKAADAVDVLVGLLRRKEDEAVSTATVRSVVKSLGSLMLLCDLEDWSKVKVPFETILEFSMDKRPKVRKSAQVCVAKVFKSFPSSVAKEASKVVLALFKSYMPRAFQLSGAKSVDGSKRDLLSKPEHLKVVHMLNSLKVIVPCLSEEVSQEMLSNLYKLLTSQFSPFTRHLFDVLEVFFEASREDVIFPEAEHIIVSLATYVSSGEKNPMDTVITASVLLKSVMSKVNGGDPSICIRKLSLVFGSIAGLLAFDTYSSQAAGILKEMIKEHVDGSTFLSSEYQTYDDKLMNKEESRAIKSTCDAFENILCTFSGIPNEHTLAVISDLFVNLGEASYIFTKGILLKLAGLMMLQERDETKRNHLQECIGSAVVAIGPEKMLTLIPVSLDPEKHICSNAWLLPILSMYVTGASLEYFLDHVMPLVESLQQACHKVKKSPRRDLQACIRGLWDLLPAFCRYPTDTHVCFERLAKVLAAFLKEDPHTHKNIALALQELVNQNRSILVSIESVSGSVKCSGTLLTKDSNGKARSAPSSYSRDVATRNIQALTSCSFYLLQAFTDIFFTSASDNRAHLKEAIGCLASITKSSKVKKLFVSSLEKFKVANVDDETEDLEGEDSISADNDLAVNSKIEEQEVANRCLIMEYAYSLIAGAKEDLLDTIFNHIKPVLQANGAAGQAEAYFILSRIFKEHAWFCSSRYDEMVELLLGAKSHVDDVTLRNRFSCFQNLLVSMLQSDLEDRNAKAFIILNEIILALKDCNEEPRKAAYDILLKISDSLNDPSLADSGALHKELLNMIMGYLSGAPPPIMSAAVAALSLLIHKNSGFCFSEPELVPSVLVLLKSKANEVIKAVLGFVKVLVSSLQGSELHKLLPDIVNGVLPWSHVSKHHFRSKVATIFEIIIRKCGYGSVEFIVPDRYRGFLKTVKEQRQGKPSSKEAETSDNGPKLAGSFPKRENKRRHGSTQGEETDSRASTSTHMDRGNKKRKFNTPSGNGFRKSDNTSRGQWVPKSKSSNFGRSESRTGGSGKPFKRKQANGRPSSGRKDNTRPDRESKTSKSPFHKAGTSSKFRKRQKAV